MAKCYRDNKKLQNQLAIHKALSQKYLMKYRREKARNKKDMKDIDSPRGKANRLLKHWSTSDCRKKSRSTDRQDQAKSKVKRSLLYHFALNKELELRYSQANRKGKIGLAEIVKGKIMRKYKLIKQAYKEIGICGRYSIKTKGSLTKRIGATVRTFYERDDNSRIMAGIKQTITNHSQNAEKNIDVVTSRSSYKIHVRKSRNESELYNILSSQTILGCSTKSNGQRHLCL